MMGYGVRCTVSNTTTHTSDCMFVHLSVSLCLPNYLTLYPPSLPPSLLPHHICLTPQVRRCVERPRSSPVDIPHRNPQGTWEPLYYMVYYLQVNLGYDSMVLLVSPALTCIIIHTFYTFYTFPFPIETLSIKARRHCHQVYGADGQGQVQLRGVVLVPPRGPGWTLRRQWQYAHNTRRTEQRGHWCCHTLG